MIAKVHEVDTLVCPRCSHRSLESAPRLCDPLEPELPHSLSKLSLVAGDELGRVGTEEPLEGADSPLAMGLRGVASRESASWSAT
jgi:hypothetical protein